MILNIQTTDGKDIMEQSPIWLYSLSTCSMCKELKQILDKKKVVYESIDVDRLGKKEQTEILEILKSYSPKLSFPTLITGDDVIVGYNKEKIAEIIKSLTKGSKFSFKNLFSKNKN